MGLHVVPQHEVSPAGDLRAGGAPLLLQAIKIDENGDRKNRVRMEIAE
jgi:hypothetical protein